MTSLAADQPHLLDGIQIRLLAPEELPRAGQLLEERHYLGSLKPVGERLHYAVTDAQGDWLGVLVFCAARDLFERLDLDGKEVSLDALHTQAETARALVLEHGADYLLTVKANPPPVQENIQRHVATPPGAFPP